MKKLALKRKKKVDQQPQSRITNETVAEHREKILAGGRKFKYPHQYVRHKLVINAILIAVVVVGVVVTLGWWQLYKVQNTSDFMYRVTRVLPLPVASVDGEQVQYSDYLMRYRSQELYLQKDGQLGLDAASDQKQLNFHKRAVLDDIERDAYALKIAKERGITVSDEEVQAAIDQERDTVTGKISQEVYDASTRDILGYSPDEYRHSLQQSLIRHKVGYSVDEDAGKLRDMVAADLAKQGKKLNLQAVVEHYKKAGSAIEFGASGTVTKSNRDGGITKAAANLTPGQLSGAVESTTGDGYYFIQLRTVSQKKLSYEYIRIPLKKFETMFDQLKKDNKIQEYIKIAT
ncbi:MAG TPA: SurA N-terminal domain-containing protein [Candidatus Saccharimonadales bacterium]